MATTFRVVIVGTGMIAEVHRRAAILAGVDIIGVLGSSPDRSREVADRWGVPIGFADLGEVIAEAPDVVHICTPNRYHYAYSMELIAAGINVICEKPLGLTADEADAMVAAANSAGVVATVPFVYRFHPMVREIRARRIRGDFGSIALIHGSYLQDWMLSPGSANWRIDPAEGGASRAFADIGTHWCDLVEWVSGETFAEVCAATSITHAQRPSGSARAFSEESLGGNVVPVLTEDVAVAQFRTTSGVLASATISQVSSGRKNRLWFELDGLDGSVAFDQENPESAWLGATSGSGIVVRDPATNLPDAARLSLLPAGHPQGYAQAFDAFVGDTYAAVSGEFRDGLPTFADGARAVQIVEAVLASAADRTWKEIK